MEGCCNLFKGIDFFGKLPEFYINGKQKQVTIFGRVLTILFILIYIIIIMYKIYRMFERIDVTFYDTYSNSDEIPSIHVTKENFSLIFAVYNDSSLPFIDESIYYPVAYFNGEEIKEIDIVRCNYNYIGNKYRKFFTSSELNNFYCLNNIDFILKPYENSVELKFFPCKNTTDNNNHCKSKEIIEETLHYNVLKVFIEDILITPINYDNPVKESLNVLDFEFFIGIGEFFYTEMEVVRIETSTNIMGFDFLSNPKIDEFIKYDNVEITPYPGNDLTEETEEEPLVDFEFQLNDKILLEKRQYIQLIDVLGEVGGFMEFVDSFFGFICSFLSDFIYQKAIMNSLISFNTKKKFISFKKRKISIFKIKGKENIEEINKRNKTLYVNSSKNLNNMKEIDDKSSENNSFNKYIFKKINKKEIDVNNSFKDNLKEHNKKKSESSLNLIKRYKTEIIIDNKDSLKKEKLKYKNILSLICNYCNNKRRNILLNKSMNIFIEKLDIFNIFRNMCLIENISKNYKHDLDIFKMSDEHLNNN